MECRIISSEWGFVLTALQSVWYHFAPQALRLQLCWLRGRSRDEHSYGGMRVNPSSDFIRHTTDLCCRPAPHSAEHWLTHNSGTNRIHLISRWKTETITAFWCKVKINVLQVTSWVQRDFHHHTWLQGPVNHSMRFSQGPLLQTWESAGRSLPHPSSGRLLMWLVRQRIPRVRTPIPHSAEHWGGGHLLQPLLLSNRAFIVTYSICNQPEVILIKSVSLNFWMFNIILLLDRQMLYNYKTKRCFHVFCSCHLPRCCDLLVILSPQPCDLAVNRNTASISHLHSLFVTVLLTSRVSAAPVLLLTCSLQWGHHTHHYAST